MIIPPELRIMTVKQPWANLIVEGIKDVENRTWAFPATLDLPFTIAVHAGVKLDPKSTAADLPRGVVVGLVDVVDCRFGPTSYDSPWALPEHYHWVLARPVKFADPVPARGRQGVMPVGPELFSAICEAART